MRGTGGINFKTAWNREMITGVPVKMGYIGTGDEAIYNTLEIMKELIKRAERLPIVRQTAAQLVNHVPERDEIAEVATIFSFVKTRTRFTKDPVSYELLQTPSFILSQIQIGMVPNLDCDDMTILSGALLRSIGYDIKLKAISVSPTREYTHVYLMVKPAKKCYCIAFDPASPVGRLGLEPAGITRYYEEEID